MKVFVQNLVVPWEFLRNQWKNLSEYHSLNHDQKIFIKWLIKIYIWCQNSICCFNWCQDTIGFQKGSLIEGEQDFIKSYHVSLKWFHFDKMMIQVWLCAPKWISHEFLAYLKIIQNSLFSTHNHPPHHELRGSAKIVQKYQTSLNLTTFLFPKCFSTYLNQLRSKISKGLIF